MEFFLLIQMMFFSFLIGFTGAMSPGPVLTAVIKETPQRGWTTGPLVVFGHAITELILFIALYLGLDVILKSPLVKLIISLAGGIILCILAILMLFDVFVKKISIIEELEKKSSEKIKKNYIPILNGIILSVSNPFWIIWWITVGIVMLEEGVPPTMVIPINFGLIGVSVFYIGHILSDFTWYTFISGMIAKGKKWINDEVYRVMLICCAGFLIYVGITFFINGIML